MCLPELPLRVWQECSHVDKWRVMCGTSWHMVISSCHNVPFLWNALKCYTSQSGGKRHRKEGWQTFATLFWARGGVSAGICWLSVKPPEYQIGSVRSAWFDSFCQGMLCATAVFGLWRPCDKNYLQHWIWHGNAPKRARCNRVKQGEATISQDLLGTDFVGTKLRSLNPGVLNRIKLTNIVSICLNVADKVWS